ncbi:unnamed protein product [marine sediment metagenome]|uniref:Uncharacterized protein n=1 Tax=marine sediment metagenome TaxID=412755 RepID=X0ZVI8_9ZZZZ
MLILKIFKINNIKNYQFQLLFFFVLKIKFDFILDSLKTSYIIHNEIPENILLKIFANLAGE